MDGTLENLTSVYITDKDRMLMLYRIGSRVVEPSWVGIGGHFEKDELNDAKAAMLRELSEEIGLNESDLTDIRLRYITLRYVKNMIRLNYFFFANLCGGVTVQDYCDEGNLEWVNIENVLDKQMPYTATYVLEHYLTQGKNTDLIYCAVVQKDGVTFTELEKF